MIGNNNKHLVEAKNTAMLALITELSLKVLQGLPANVLATISEERLTDIITSSLWKQMDKKLTEAE